MAVIAFSDEPEDIWRVAGWVLRTIFEDVTAQYPGDGQMEAEFEQAEALSGLNIDRLDSELAARTTTRFRNVVEGILSGAITSVIERKGFGTKETREQYMLGLRELLPILKRRYPH